MIAQIICSYQLIAKKFGLTFRSQQDLLTDGALALSCSIEHDGESWGHALYPDGLFALNDKYFVIEADRNEEPIWRNDFKTSSYRHRAPIGAIVTGRMSAFCETAPNRAPRRH
jgi:hypothetical protein